MWPLRLHSQHLASHIALAAACLCVLALPPLVVEPAPHQPKSIFVFLLHAFPAKSGKVRQMNESNKPFGSSDLFHLLQISRAKHSCHMQARKWPLYLIIAQIPVLVQTNSRGPAGEPSQQHPGAVCFLPANLLQGAPGSVTSINRCFVQVGDFRQAHHWQGGQLG